MYIFNLVKIGLVVLEKKTLTDGALRTTHATHVQFCAKSEDNFQNVPIISYKTTIFQKIILKTFLIQF